jgi:hypothetical protein
MDEMREIVTVEQMDRLFMLLAVAGPLVGLVIGGVWGARKGGVSRSSLVGLGIGLLAMVNLLLWKVYNAITDRLGMDTVKNLLVNVGLFVALGAIAGFAAGFVARRKAVSGPPAEEVEEAAGGG